MHLTVTSQLIHELCVPPNQIGGRSLSSMVVAALGDPNTPATY
jgi:hypothetical protein